MVDQRYALNSSNKGRITREYLYFSALYLPRYIQLDMFPRDMSANCYYLKILNYLLSKILKTENTVYMKNISLNFGHRYATLFYNVGIYVYVFCRQVPPSLALIMFKSNR